MNLEKITLTQDGRSLNLLFDDNFSEPLSLELLRVLASSETLKRHKQPHHWVTHKKNVHISNIESVGKHGYRMIFDDGFSDIFSVQLLREFCHNQEALWQEYLDAMQQLHLSRESMIEIKEVK